MRILNVSSLFPPNAIGGAEITLKTLADAMAADGNDVHVVTLAPPDHRYTAPETGDRLVTAHHVPLANIYWPFDSLRHSRSHLSKAIWHGIDTANVIMAHRVERVVRDVRPDVVVTHNLQGFSTAVMPAVKRAGLPVVHVLHDVSLICPQTTLSRGDRNCGNGRARCCRCRMLTAPRRQHLRAVDGVISVSGALLDLHRAHGLFTEIPSAVIYNALKPAFEIRDSIAPAGRRQLFTLGFLGRVERAKGIETLLTAASELEARGALFRLRIAGRAEPGYLETLRRRWPLARIEYLGFVEAPEFLRSIDALVVPSEGMEGLPSGVLEAFSQGLPVIGSAVGGIPEAIAHGVNGFVFRPGDVAELTDYISELQANPELRRSFGAAALLKAREHLAPSRAAEYLAFLDRVVSIQRDACAA